MRYLITSALPYINGIKHLGNVVGSMLPADAYARFLRARGEEVLYICATDEHGTPAELAALAEGLEVSAYCTKMHELQAELGKKFGFSFDHFGRSSSPQNRELTQHFARELGKNGFTDVRATKQVYAVEDGRFLPDRYIVGTCPHCGFTGARGDQCESCTRLLDPTDLKDPRSAVSGSKQLEVRESNHLYLLQSKMADDLRAWITSRKDWPLLTTSIALKWLDEGLLDRCITRSLKWGVPVDQPGLEDKVFYVWFDAPIEYIGATKEWADAKPGRDWKSWWWDAKDVHYTQFMAKDNIPFHTIVFPAMLMGTKEPWKVADMIKGVNWLTYQGGKFSTSSHRGVFMNDAVELLPADYWRYWLLANAPESTDADFTWELFAGVVNKDLVGVIGNFVNRILKFTETKLAPEIPGGGTVGEVETKYFGEVQARLDTLTQNFADLSYRKAVMELRTLWADANTFITERAPWSHVATDRPRAELAVRLAINLIRVLAIVSEPVIPEAAGKIMDGLGLTPEERRWPQKPIAEELATLAAGRTFKTPDLLFRRIAPEEVAAWKARFDGASAST